MDGSGKGGRRAEAAAARDAVMALYEEHYGAMVGFARLLLHESSAAEDIAQEAFLRLYKAWHRVRDQERALAYVRVTVRNLVFSRARSMAVARAHPADAPGDDRSAEDAVIELDTARLVIDALGHLSVRQRECIVLRHYFGLSESEIAEEVGCSIGSVRTHLKRAAAHLVELIPQSAYEVPA